MIRYSLALLYTVAYIHVNDQSALIANPSCNNIINIIIDYDVITTTSM